jgi:hypothetical protein
MMSAAASDKTNTPNVAEIDAHAQPVGVRHDGAHVAAVGLEDVHTGTSNVSAHSVLATVLQEARAEAIVDQPHDLVNGKLKLFLHKAVLSYENRIRSSKEEVDRAPERVTFDTVVLSQQGTTTIPASK